MEQRVLKHALMAAIAGGLLAAAPAQAQNILNYSSRFHTNELTTSILYQNLSYLRKEKKSNSNQIRICLITMDSFACYLKLKNLSVKLINRFIPMKRDI